jgi:hypothetical protein
VGCLALLPPDAKGKGEGGKQALLFCKKAAKNFRFHWCVPVKPPEAKFQKVFCCFFTKKQCLPCRPWF